MNHVKEALVADARARGLGLDNSGTASAPVQSEQTRLAYVSRGKGLLRRYRTEEEVPVDAETSPTEFVRWLVDEVRPSLSSNAWWQYRASARAVLDGFGDEGAAAAEALRVAPAGALVEKRTSSRKAKRFPRADLDRTLTYLRTSSTSGLAPSLADWLVAGTATGLRPSEWRAARLDGDRLYVMNGKRSNGRSNGDVRTLDVSGLRPATLAAVARMVDRGRAWVAEGRWTDMQRQHAHYLPTAALRACGRRYTLYSLRHQFVSNAKRELDPEEVAALAGHCVDHTATRSYGRRKSAWAPGEQPDVVLPLDEEVAMVRRGARTLSREEAEDRRHGL